MDYDADVFCEQFPIVKRFLYHLTCYKELYRVYQELDLKSEFWTHTIDAHLLQACILWCMVFGSDGCNPTHWKKLCEEDLDSLQKSFREGLFQKTSLTQETWLAYWKMINDFRNKYSAHREPRYSKPVPNFKLAQEIAYYYDEWIRGIIAPDIFEEPPLEKSVLIMQKRIRPLITNFLSITKLIRGSTE
jgi:hypothetical protein